MTKKLLPLLTLFFLISCSTSKPVVRSQKPRVKPQVTRTVKKPLPTARTENPSSPTEKNNQGNRTTEVIVSTSRTVVYSDVVNNYVNNYKGIAISNMKNFGIPASIILAQGILESGAGKGSLALKANNHFGIKCHAGWTGESVNHDDDSDQECFRKYNDPVDSYKDHALFLTSRSRYAHLFNLQKGDYEAWARGLRASGYATDPKYPEKLISYIEKYNLHQYDSQVLGTAYIPKNTKVKKEESISYNNEGFHEVQQGETLYSISKKYNLTVEDLKQKNNLPDNTLSIGQKLKI